MLKPRQVCCGHTAFPKVSLAPQSNGKFGGQKRQSETRKLSQSGACSAWLRRDVDQLAELLGPLLAPLVSKAVNLASAAYVARTLARPAIPASKSADACQHSPSSSSARSSTDKSKAGSTALWDAPEADLQPLRRSATASWILSEGYGSSHALGTPGLPRQVSKLSHCL